MYVKLNLGFLIISNLRANIKNCEYFDPSLSALVKNLTTKKTYSPARPLVSGAGGDKTLILCTFVILYRIAPT